MKTFLIRLMAFALMAFLCLSVADYLYSLVVRKQTDTNMEIWKDVMEGNATADILVLGDSRVNTDCYPPILDSITGLSSYDIGVVGQHFSAQKLRYYMYRKNNNKPKLIVQFVDSWLFLPLSYYDKLQFFPWMWYPSFIKAALEVDPRFFVGKLIPWIRYRGVIPTELSLRDRISYKGFFTYDTGKAVTMISASAFAFVESRRNEMLFRSFVKAVKDEGIPIVFVIAPIYECGSYDKSIIASLRERLKVLSEENDVLLMDYLGLSISEDPSMFIDSIHLNERGARAFTDSLANDLVRLGLLRQ